MIISDNIALTVLIYILILAAVIFLIKIIVGKNNSKESNKLNIQNDNNVLEKDDSAIANMRSSSDLPEDELIAVLTAAVSACMKPGVQSKIRVKSFRRIDSNAPMWNLVGRFDRIRTKI